MKPIYFLIIFFLLLSGCYSTQQISVLSDTKKESRGKEVDVVFQYDVLSYPSQTAPYTELQVTRISSMQYPTQRTIQEYQKKNFLGKLPIVVGACGIVGGMQLFANDNLVPGIASMALSSVLFLVNNFLPNYKTVKKTSLTGGYVVETQERYADKGETFILKTKDGSLEHRFSTDASGRIQIDYLDAFKLCNQRKNLDVNFYMFDRKGYKVARTNGMDYFSVNPMNFCPYSNVSLSKGTRAEVLWKSSTISSSTQYNVDVCIRAQSRISRSDISLFVNDKLIQDHPLEDSFLGNTLNYEENCTYRYQKQIKLNPGKNELRIEIQSTEIAPTISAIEVKQEKINRYALVIGNSTYKKIGQLRNPQNDARDIAVVLREKGFDVIECIDCDKRKMDESLDIFISKLRVGKGIGFFYYAGHGVQFQSSNYLLPIDITANSRAEVVQNAVSLNVVLEKMSSARNLLNIVVLDACRDDPFKKSTTRGFTVVKGEEQNVSAPQQQDPDEAVGLAPPPQLPKDAPGFLIAYSTSPGAVAEDGDGKNGLYTQELLKVMRMNGIKIEDAFKRVRNNIRQMGKSQIPWENTSLTEDFEL
ncbi:MAG: caspase family protein [Cytophagales bacterium]|nr:caspase family protein [Cytophagales bacterium]MDW8384807.1 caspase family protein [Flammeovirgaceae bacterium]